MMPDAQDTDWTVAANEAKKEVLIFATWAGTHTVGDNPAGGGPSGKSTSTHFVYKLHFDGAGKIDSLTKVRTPAPAAPRRRRRRHNTTRRYRRALIRLSFLQVWNDTWCLAELGWA